LTVTRLEDFLAACQRRVEIALDRWLPAPSVIPGRLHEAMRYSVLAPGKRVRPVLVYAAGHAVGVEPARLDGVACAVEMIHAYSLIHDDLPAMDDDDLRRGRPTCHRRFDEATAILAGDALQPLAFEVICRDTALPVDAATRVEMIEILALASGSRGMAGGQAMDLAATGHPLSLPELENLHIHKTGALIRACVQLGTLAGARAARPVRSAIDHYAKCIGLAFQIRDDVLDVSGSAATLGKTQGKDAAQDKTTYAALLGLDSAQRKADALRNEALASIREIGEAAAPLRWLADYIVNRTH
jgi:geranylgeranyl pyrophosphate synthase